MSPRRHRIQRVVDLREKELDKRVTKLVSSRSAEAQALSVEETKQRELEQASESRLKLAEADSTLSVKSWVEANEWLTGRRLHHEQARVEVARAQLETLRVQGEVMVARTDLKKVEVLSSRIEEQEQKRTGQLERKLEDELAALRFRLTRAEHEE